MQNLKDEQVLGQVWVGGIKSEKYKITGGQVAARWDAGDPGREFGREVEFGLFLF